LTVGPLQEDEYPLKRNLFTLNHQNRPLTKEIAWNGIRFNAPSSWEVAHINSCHLILENASQPAMEVKWSSIKGKFSHRTHLKRLAAHQAKSLKKSISEWRLPSDWKRALADFETSGFIWQGETRSGRGVILFCPTCRNATLIQFFLLKSVESGKDSLDVLKSFKDHDFQDQVAWSIFEMRARIPREFSLSSHSFQTGIYTLTFINRKQHLELYRWAPASAWLSRQDLAQFARTLPEFNTGIPRAVHAQGHQAVEWQRAPRSKWFGWLSHSKRNPAYQWWRVWHVEQKNRILGVRMHGKKPYDDVLLNTICANYEIS
jgi:hypothetical protein